VVFFNCWDGDVTVSNRTRDKTRLD
jgi:hypothetical protein